VKYIIDNNVEPHGARKANSVDLQNHINSTEKSGVYGC
jgi:hypothetical protein